jgi:hypothetical protein
MWAELDANSIAKEGVGARLGAVWGAFGYKSQRLLRPVFGGICTGHGAILRVSGGFGFSGEELADGKRKRSAFQVTNRLHSFASAERFDAGSNRASRLEISAHL